MRQNSGGSGSSGSSDLKVHLRAAVEVAFIVFLFYSNLLMGEFTRANGAGKTWTSAILDIFTWTNFGIGMVAAVIGHAVFEAFRRKLL